MSVHGRDRGEPRRLGLDAAAAAAGIVAAQGVLAALVARARGRPVRRVHTSVLHAALLLLSHHLALATSAEPLSPGPPGDGPGPPFRTADGAWVEIEALGFGPWMAFWTRLGADRAVPEAAWSPFVHRYLAAACALPAALHAAAARHTLAALRAAGEACGVAVCRVRGYPEVIAELGEPGSRCAPWRIRPAAGQAAARPAAPPPDAGAPLAGMRVVEVTSRMQGPLAGLLLRMLGAGVEKVEPPGGDFGRHSPPLAGGLGAAYLAYNRGKRVVEIDYKDAGGRARLVELAARADVFLHNWRSGRAAVLGLDRGALARPNPGLVYAHASGWSPVHPEPAPIAGDFLVQAHAACGQGLNPDGEPPFPSRLTLLDATGGLLACEGVLAALYLRERTGRGARVDTSLLGAAMALQEPALREMVFERERGRRMGRPLWGPLDTPLRTAGGWLAVDLADEDARPRLARSLGADPSDGDARLAAFLAARTAAEWEARLREAGVPAAAVREELSDLPSDPRAAGLLERVEDACWMPAAPWRLEA
jgi:crotonobetainyl-CoA:carnitine CoA-transferase CaiB-like acyl-CoA transferase